MILTIPRPPRGTPRVQIARLFGVSRDTLRAADKQGRFIRTARVFTLEVRSVGTYNIVRPHPPRLTCAYCECRLSPKQVKLNRTYCSRRCAAWQRKEAGK